MSGRAVAANLPSHSPQRMADRARSRLERTGLEARAEPFRVRVAFPGEGIFLTAEYENVSAGFNALGRRGFSSEAVAGQAVTALARHRDSCAALDAHLAKPVFALKPSPDTLTHSQAKGFRQSPGTTDGKP